MLEFITLDEAQKLILNRLSTLGQQEVALEHALGRVVFNDIRAELDIPPFDRSPLDGYALRGEDLLRSASTKLKLIGEVPAGYNFLGEVTPGTAVKILTGSPIPRGANAVVRQEDTEELSGFILVHKAVLPGANISRQGEDLAAQDLLVNAGSEITPAVLGVLASQGFNRLNAYTRPKVAIVSSGDELKNVDEILSQGQIYNSNFFTLSGMIKEWGGDIVSLGLSQDNPRQLGEIIGEGLRQADLVVTTGGASVGEYDVTLRALEHAQVTPLFWRVAVKPGTPVLCGEKDGKLVIGLSGNPAAAMISAALLLGPAVRRLAGFTRVIPKKLHAVSTSSFDRPSGVTRLVRARLEVLDAGLVVNIPDQQQPGVLKSMLNTNALVEIPAGSTLNQGELCGVYLLNEWEEQA